LRLLGRRRTRHLDNRLFCAILRKDTAPFGRTAAAGGIRNTATQLSGVYRLRRHGCSVCVGESVQFQSARVFRLTG
jgi:hypothetical protein